MLTMAGGIVLAVFSLAFMEYIPDIIGWLISLPFVIIRELCKFPSEIKRGFGQELFDMNLRRRIRHEIECSGLLRQLSRRSRVADYLQKMSIALFILFCIGLITLWFPYTRELLKKNGESLDTPAGITLAFFAGYLLLFFSASWIKGPDLDEYEKMLDSMSERQFQETTKKRGKANSKSEKKSA